MKTQDLVKKMRNESKEVQNSVGGTHSYRSVMNTVLSNHIEMIGNYDDSRFRTDHEISEIVEKIHSVEEIKSVKNIYDLKSKGN